MRMGKPTITKETLKEIAKKTRIRSQNANARMAQLGVPLQMRMTININEDGKSLSHKSLNLYLKCQKLSSILLYHPLYFGIKLTLDAISKPHLLTMI